jgi:hypothetical protein
MEFTDYIEYTASQCPLLDRLIGVQAVMNKQEESDIKNCSHHMSNSSEAVQPSGAALAADIT